MMRDLRARMNGRLLLTGLMLVLALGLASCSSTKADLQRSDVEQMYKDNRIDRVTYVDLMQQIDAREAAARTASGSTPPASTNASQPASPASGQASH